MELFLGIFSKDWEQWRAASVHDRERLRAAGDHSDDEWFRHGSGGSQGTGVEAFGNRGRGSSDGPSARFAARGGGFRSASARPSVRPMAVRLEAVAKGSQPVVVKLASYGGGSRASAMVNYVSREGRIPVENERGELIEGSEGLGSVPAEWDHLMSNRAESRDVAIFGIEIPGDHSGLDDDSAHELAMAVAVAALGDRRFAFAVERTVDGNERGGLVVTGLAVLRSPSSGERLTADGKAEEIVQARLDQAKAEGRVADSATFAFYAHGNGADYATAKLRGLIADADGPVKDERGAVIGDADAAGNLVQNTWRHEMQSRKARDVMHLIMSAREGTDVDAFRIAAREFLAAEFGERGFRYVFAVHDPKDDPKDEQEGGKRPHVHAHAIVTMRSDFGDRVETSPQIFRDWRSTFAEKAREAGIAMEMTDRREFANAPAFTINDVRPVSRTGRTEYEGTSIAGERRYRNKRENRPARTAATERSQDYQKEAKSAWLEIGSKNPQNDAGKYAKAMVERIDSVRAEAAHTIGNPDQNAVANRPNMVSLFGLLREEMDMENTSRAEFEAYEKRVEIALFKTERTVDDSNRVVFEDIASSVRELVDARREQLELLEQWQQMKDDRPDPSDEEALRDYYISRHGEAAVERGNEVMLDIEWAREEIEKLESSADDYDEDQVAALKETLDASLHEAAELALTGNGFIRDIAELDTELKAEISFVEDRQRRELDTHGAGDARNEQAPSEQSDGLGVDIDAGENDRPDEQAADDADQAKSLFRQIEQINQNLDRRNRDQIEAGETEAADQADASDPENTADQRQTDPAKQQVPRLEELQREHDEQVRRERERDRDDREI